jgi:hypothetical protein
MGGSPDEVNSIISHTFPVSHVKAARDNKIIPAFVWLSRKKRKILDFNVLASVICFQGRFCGAWCTHKNSGLRPEGGRGV